MSKIHSNQSISYLLLEQKQLELRISKIQKHLFIIHKQLIMLMKIQKTIIQQRNGVLIVFDDIIVDMESNKKLSRIVTELFLRGIKLNMSIVFISQSHFKVPKTIGLNVTHYFIMKILNRRELQQIPSNHSSDIDFKDFMKFYKEYSKKPYSFLVRDMNVSSDNPL